MGPVLQTALDDALALGRHARLLAAGALLGSRTRMVDLHRENAELRRDLTLVHLRATALQKALDDARTRP